MSTHVKRYLVVCEETCPACKRTGTPDCLICDGTGVKRSEVDLKDALKGLRPTRKTRTHDKRNTSGTIGVSLSKTVSEGRIVGVFWTAQFREDGRQRTRSWSIREHGYRQAFKLAAAERAKHTGQTVGRCPKPTEELKEWAKENKVKL